MELCSNFAFSFLDLAWRSATSSASSENLSEVMIEQ